MKIKFELTQEELMAFNKHYLRSSGTQRKFYLALGFFGVAMVFFIFHQLKETFGSGEIFLLVVIALVFFLVFRKVGNNLDRGIKKSIQKDPGLIGERSIEFGETELVLYSPVSEYRHKNKSIVKIEETKKLLLIFTGKTQAIILPKAFISVREIEETKKIFGEIEWKSFT